jgi:hypothetical protein
MVGALKEYAAIVKGTREEYTQQELTVKVVREDHPKLDFMDDEEIQEIIDFANRGRSEMVTCPDCGSQNIEIVEGAIYQCEANHSGECQECLCAWTID